VYRLLNPLSFVAFKMGRPRGGRSRTGAKGASLTRYVTDEQRSSRPILNATKLKGFRDGTLAFIPVTNGLVSERESWPLHGKAPKRVFGLAATFKARTFEGRSPRKGK
jgi:hypothetical protein